MEETWQIKCVRLAHNCEHHSAVRKVTSDFLAESYIDHFRDDPKLKLDYFIKFVRRDIGAKVSYHKAWYAKKIDLYMIHGSAVEQYNRVWDYTTAIRKYIAGSSAVVEVTGIERPPVTFQRMHVCLQPLKEGFIQGCRHVLGVDGCHLKGLWPGVCLTAVGKDGNNNLFPVAWAIVEVENKESRAWFLDLLTKDLGSVTEHITWIHENEELTFMSDRQKVLLDAFKKVVPEANVRFCCRHTWANFKLKFPGEDFKDRPFLESSKSKYKVARCAAGVDFKFDGCSAFRGREWLGIAFNDGFKGALGCMLVLGWLQVEVAAFKEGWVTS